jgi:hypothetical protein
MAVGLLLVRNAVDPHTLVAVALLAGGAFAAVLLAYWLIWFDEAERRLVKGLLGRAG